MTNRSVFFRRKSPQGPWQRFAGPLPITVSGFPAGAVLEYDIGDALIRELTTGAPPVVGGPAPLTAPSISPIEGAVGATFTTTPGTYSGATAIAGTLRQAGYIVATRTDNATFAWSSLSDQAIEWTEQASNAQGVAAPRTASAQVTAPQAPANLGPNINPMTARLVFVGASLMDRGASNSERRGYVDACRAALGFTGDRFFGAQSAEGFNSTIARVRDIIIPAVADTAANNLYVLHRSGNDVTINRPWSPDQQGFWLGSLQTLREMIEAEGSACLFGDVTYRSYPAEPGKPADNPHNPDTAINGSGPYNAFFVHPFIRDQNPRWWDFQNRRPRVEFHTFTRDRLGVLEPDGVHLEPDRPDIFYAWILDQIATAARGELPPENLSGRTLLCSVTQGPNHRTWVNGWNGICHFQPAIRTSIGAPANGVVVDMRGFGPIEPLGYSDQSWTARVAETRFHGQASHIAQFATYVSAPAELTKQRHPTGSLIVRGMTPGAQGTITLMGLAAGVTTPDHRMTITQPGVGGSWTLDAAENAPSNQVVIPFTVPASGRLQFDCVPAAASRFGVLSGFVIDLAAVSEPEPVNPLVVQSSTEANASGATTSLSVPVPAGVQSGDLMLAVVATGASTGAVTPPSGWTQVFASPGVQPPTSSVAIFRRVAGASEPASYAFTLSASLRAVGTILRLTNAGAVGNVSGWASDLSGPIATAPGTTTTAANSLLVNVVITGGGLRTFASLDGPTIARQIANNNNSGDRVSMAVAVQGRAVPGATGARTYAIGGGDSTSGGVSFTVAPA